MLAMCWWIRQSMHFVTICLNHVCSLLFTFYASLDPNDATIMLEKHQYRLVLWAFFPVPKIPSLKQTICNCKNDGWKMILFFWHPVRFPVSFRKGNLQTLQTIGSMGRKVHLPTWMVDLYGKLVGDYTVRPMDLMGNHLQPLQKLNCKLGAFPLRSRYLGGWRHVGKSSLWLYLWRGSSGLPFRWVFQKLTLTGSAGWCFLLGDHYLEYHPIFSKWLIT